MNILNSLRSLHHFGEIGITQSIVENTAVGYESLRICGLMGRSAIVETRFRKRCDARFTMNVVGRDQISIVVSIPI